MAFVPAQGTLLKLGDNSSPIGYTTVAQLGDIDGVISYKNELEDITSHNDPDRAKRSASTILDTGSPKIKVWWDASDTTLASGAASLRALAASGVLCNFEFYMPQFSPAATVVFQAIVETYDLKAPVKGMFTAEIQLRKSGPDTFTP